MTAALLYDGIQAVPQDVDAAVDGGALGITYANGDRETIDPALLSRAASGRDTLRLARSDRGGWRLSIPAAYGGEFEALLGREEKCGRWVDRIGLVPALVAFSLVAAGAVAVGYLAPHWLAPHVPRSWERNVGDAIVGDFGDNRCRNAEGQRALHTMVERLAPGALTGSDPIRIAALDIDMFNAAALPGGHIVVFEAAITETEDPDALAGILAHEIAHVRRRHVTEALIRELGIGAFIRLFAGDIGANANQLIALSYTREAEEEADADAIAMLNRAGISPIPTARLFQRLGSDEEEGTSYAAEFLSSHPLSRDRARKFAAAHDPARTYSPVLTEAQADDLFNICWDGPQQP